MDVMVPAQRIEVLTETDVLVCGGGCAGVAAAVSAARHGARVALLERWPSIGGMATNALVNGWHRSDREKVVINGLVEESAQRAAKHRWIVQVREFPRTHETHWFEPEGMRIVWQRMLDEAKVRTFCYLAAGEPLLENGRIRGVLCDTKVGRRAVLAKVVIDATGDGDLAAKAGVPFAFGRQADGLVQGLTQMFALRNIDQSPEAQRQRRERLDGVMAEMRARRARGELPPFNDDNVCGLVGYWGAPNHMPWNMCPVAGNPLDEEELSRLTARAREQIVQYLEFWRAQVPGMANAELEQTGFAIGVRESRRITGRKTLTAEMVLGAQKQPDAVGHGVWMVDIHDPKGSGYTTYSDSGDRLHLKPGTSYHIPLNMALNDQVPNLAVPCRAASTTHEALASFRVQTHLMALAQGVGTAAALALDAAVELAAVDMGKLQANLRADGVYLEDVPAACAS
jgi:hypothetical protein